MYGKKLFALILFVALISANGANAQRRYNYFSFGPSLGVSHYQGDLDDNGFDWWAAFEASKNRKIGSPLKLLKPGVGLQLNYHFNGHMYIKMTYNQGWIGAADSLNKDFARQYRNLHFRSALSEVSVQLVYEFFGNERHYRYRPVWSPYVFTGVAVFNFNPKAKPNDEWYDPNTTIMTSKTGLVAGDYAPAFDPSIKWVALQPLGTEGQNLSDPRYNKPYKLTQVSIPFGLGIRRKINDKVDIRFDIGIRKTFTDYLDDVSGDIDPLVNGGAQRPNGTFYDGGAYADQEALFLDNPLSMLFADRSGYTQYGRNLINVDGVFQGAYHAGGEIRGNKNDKDWYAFTSMALTFILDKGDKCPKLN